MNFHWQSKYIYALVFAATSCIAGVDAYRTWQAGQRTLEWIPVDGRVTGRELISRSEGSSFRIHIEYDVGGSTYHLVTAEKIVIEDEVTVYYDPAQPADAVVIPGVRKSRFALSALAAIIGIVGCITNLVLLMWPGLESEESKYDGGPF